MQLRHSLFSLTILLLLFNECIQPQEILKVEGASASHFKRPLKWLSNRSMASRGATTFLDVSLKSPSFISSLYDRSLTSSYMHTASPCKSKYSLTIDRKYWKENFRWRLKIRINGTFKYSRLSWKWVRQILMLDHWL